MKNNRRLIPNNQFFFCKYSKGLRISIRSGHKISHLKDNFKKYLPRRTVFFNDETNQYHAFICGIFFFYHTGQYVDCNGMRGSNHDKRSDR